MLPLSVCEQAVGGFPPDDPFLRVTLAEIRQDVGTFLKDHGGPGAQVLSDHPVGQLFHGDIVVGDDEIVPLSPPSERRDGDVAVLNPQALLALEEIFLHAPAGRFGHPRLRPRPTRRRRFPCRLPGRDCFPVQPPGLRRRLIVAHPFIPLFASLTGMKRNPRGCQ